VYLLSTDGWIPSLFSVDSFEWRPTARIWPSLFLLVQQCEFTESGNGVFCYRANTTARLNDCTIHHNAWYGLKACHAVVDLYGTKTDIHSNNSRGIWATDRGKVNIHLPAQHNTSHDNVRSNRYQHSGGSIANHNADGTFTHAVVDDGL